MKLTAFKAYDIRGIIGDDLTDEIVPLIANGVVQITKAKRVAVGYDVRETSSHFAKLLTDAFVKAGVDVYDLGLCGTEETYFASFNGTSDGKDIDAGIVVTASHNPIEYNGFKIVKGGGKPFTSDGDMPALKEFVEKEQTLPEASEKGKIIDMKDKTSYIQHLLSYIDVKKLKPLKIVVTAGNGCAGPVVDLLEKHLPFELIKVNHEPDGSFPNGIPNPLLPEMRLTTIKAMQKHGADLGVAWDGDFDRCFLFDHEGNFVNSYYLVGLLATQILAKNKGANIVYDQRLLWNTLDMVEKAGGKAVVSKVGHGYIKKVMRENNAIFGGEMSGHFYFKEFACCDTGMIPWLIIAQAISESGKSLQEMVAGMKAAFPAAEETNRPLKGDTQETLNVLEEHYKQDAVDVDKMDGLSMSFENWRFNVRPSSNEPLLRLNIETRGDKSLLREKEAELSTLIENM